MIEDIKKEALNKGVPLIKDEGLAFLLRLIQERECRDILELGTAVGYSAMQIASLNRDIRIDTIEKNDEMYAEAIANIREYGFIEQIHVYHIEIEKFTSEKLYDLIFIDAAKAQYGRYMEQFLPNLKQNGIMFFDNMIFHGLIYEADQIQSRSLRSLVKKIIRFREMVHNDDRFDIMLFDNIGDGVLVLKRRKCET